MGSSGKIVSMVILGGRRRRIGETLCGLGTRAGPGAICYASLRLHWAALKHCLHQRLMGIGSTYDDCIGMTGLELLAQNAKVIPSLANDPNQNTYQEPRDFDQFAISSRVRVRFGRLIYRNLKRVELQEGQGSVLWQHVKQVYNAKSSW